MSRRKGRITVQGKEREGEEEGERERERGGKRRLKHTA